MAADRSTGELSRRAEGRRLALIGFLAAIVTLFVLPPLFGLIGVILGLLAVRRDAALPGWSAVIVSVVLSALSTWLALDLVHRL